MQGIQHWQNETCIRFVPASPRDHFKIRFRSDQEGCWSLVGRHLFYYDRTQDVSIGQGCLQVSREFFLLFVTNVVQACKLSPTSNIHDQANQLVLKVSIHFATQSPELI